MDVFAEHGIAGIVGLLFNGLFATDAIIGLDGVNTGIPLGGWVVHNYKQLYIQIAYIVACVTYSFVVSALLAYAINAIPGCALRADEAAELLGMDDDQLGEFAYDYVEVRRDYLAWTPAKDEPHPVEAIVEPRERHGIREHGDMMAGASSDGSSQVGTQRTLEGGGEKLGGVESGDEKVGGEALRISGDGDVRRSG